MAENDNSNDKQNTGAQATDQPQGPLFALQRIYLKDASFESPRSPAVFQGQWTPKISFNINTRNSVLAEGVFDVVLSLTVEAKMEDNAAFLVEVQQAGVFSCAGFSEQELEHVLAAVCPNILFPYARETIDGLVTRGSFPALMLAPVNFEAIYQQSKQQASQQAGAASGEVAAANGDAANGGDKGANA